MVNVKESIPIEKPASKVFSFISDLHNDTKWISGIEKIDFDGKLPLKNGDRVKRIVHFMGKEIVYVMEMIEITKSRLSMRSIEGPIPMGVLYTITGDEKRSSM